MKLPPIAGAVPAVPTTDDTGAAARAGGPERPAVRDDTPPPAVDPQTLQQLADTLTQRIGTAGQQLQFSVDSDTGKTVLRVTDAESGALLRQIPGDEALAIARILDRMQGMLIRQKA